MRAARWGGPYWSCTLRGRLGARAGGDCARRIALAIEQALNGGHQQGAILGVGFSLLRDHLVLMRELLVSQVARGLYAPRDIGCLRRIILLDDETFRSGAALLGNGFVMRSS